MSVKDILQKAVSCDQEGRIMEAQDLYKSGIQILMKIVDDETDIAKKKNYYERIKDYINRTEQIKQRVQKQATQGQQVKHLPIDDDSSGHSYDELFGSFLDAKVQEILLEEPYLKEKYHFHNLIVFFELVVKKCPKLKYIRLVTKQDDKEQSVQSFAINQIKEDLKERGICLSVFFENTLHDRKIILGNGYIIKIGRGIHFYKQNSKQWTLGLNDNYYRKCRQTDVDIWLVKA